MSSIRIQLGLVSGLFMFSLSAFGQTFRGGIAGNVADTTGAAIPEATVKIEQTATGLTRTATTPTSGDFNFPDLPTGLYTVTVSRQGFQTQKIDNVDVAVGRITSLPLTLTVAAQAQTYEVLKGFENLQRSTPS